MADVCDASEKISDVASHLLMGQVKHYQTW